MIYEVLEVFMRKHVVWVCYYATICISGSVRISLLLCLRIFSIVADCLGEINEIFQISQQTDNLLLSLGQFNITAIFMLNENFEFEPSTEHFGLRNWMAL